MEVELNNEWVKIFVVDNEQVLVIKDFDNEKEDDQEMLVISMNFDGVKVDAKMTFKTEELRNKAFEAMSTDRVTAFARSLIEDFK